MDEGGWRDEGMRLAKNGEDGLREGMDGRGWRDEEMRRAKNERKRGRKGMVEGE